MVLIAQEWGRPLTKMNDWNSRARSMTDSLLSAKVEPISLSKTRVTVLTTSKGAENVFLFGPRYRTRGWVKPPQHMGLIRAAFLRLGHSFCLPIQFGEALFAGPLMTLNHSGMMGNFCLCRCIVENFMAWMSAKCPSSSYCNSDQHSFRANHVVCF